MIRTIVCTLRAITKPKNKLVAARRQTEQIIAHEQGFIEPTQQVRGRLCFQTSLIK